MSRARRFADKGNLHSLVLNATDGSASDIGEKVLLDGTDTSASNSGFTNDDMYASTVDVSEVFYMDGDDYVEGYVYQASEDGQACSVFGSTLATTFSGYLIARSNVSPQKDNNTP